MRKRNKRSKPKRRADFTLKDFRGLKDSPYGSKKHKASAKKLWGWLKS